ncbi:phage antirepressor KilAC domain-containing protein [Paenibacillus polysaccharolyticus]|uniref:phage antirepressor KilAC domain-containing protein n=1 Tax=Paenibacillus polysaccharolyticus TaxID=582692 RepID=UPI0030093E4F
MNQLNIVNHNGILLADSREVAVMTEKRHSDLLRDIEGYKSIMDENADLRSQDFFIESTYKTEGNNKTYKNFLITKLGCDMVANKMTGTKGVLFTATYVKQFNEMEQRAATQNKPSYMIEDSVERAKRWIEEEEARKAVETKSRELEQKIKEQETPVAIYNLAIAANNSMSMQEVAKSLNTGRTRLYRILREEGIIMKDSTLPYQRYIEAGYFKVVERPRASGDSIVNDPATRVMAKGFDFIAKLLQKIATRNQDAI